MKGSNLGSSRQVITSIPCRKLSLALYGFTTESEYLLLCTRHTTSRPTSTTLPATSGVLPLTHRFRLPASVFFVRFLLSLSRRILSQYNSLPLPASIPFRCVHRSNNRNDVSFFSITARSLPTVSSDEPALDLGPSFTVCCGVSICSSSHQIVLCLHVHQKADNMSRPLPPT